MWRSCFVLLYAIVLTYPAASVAQPDLEKQAKELYEDGRLSASKRVATEWVARERKNSAEGEYTDLTSALRTLAKILIARRNFRGAETGLRELLPLLETDNAEQLEIADVLDDLARVIAMRHCPLDANPLIDRSWAARSKLANVNGCLVSSETAAQVETSCGYGWGPRLTRHMRWHNRKLEAERNALLNAFGDMARSPGFQDSKKIGQSILASPEVDRDAFSTCLQALEAIRAGSTLCASRSDKAMQVSHVSNRGIPRAGDVPPDGPVIVKALYTIGTTHLATEIFSANYSAFAESRELIGDISHLFRQGSEPPNLQWPPLHTVNTAQGSYWEYVP
jgi:hypothetical protein